jgi:predicted O-methyltransferase YrrM
MDPTDIYRTRDGIYAGDLLIAAVAEFDFFSWLSGRRADLSEICGDLGIQQRPADVMCTLFTSMGLIRRDGDRFAVTELATEHLVADSPFDMRQYLAMLRDRPGCRELVGVLRTGETPAWTSDPGAHEWSKEMEKPGFADGFTAGMDGRGAYIGPALAAALDLRGAERVLDVAGGSGVYACALVERFPHLRATVLERPPVDGIARQRIGDRGYADRVDVISADMFADALPKGHDVHLFSHVLHDWDEPRVRQLLESSFASLAPGGMVADHDAHLDADKGGPLPVAEYSVLVMRLTQGKCWSIGELRSVLTDVGFTDLAVAPTAVHRSVVTARKP